MEVIVNCHRVHLVLETLVWLCCSQVRLGITAAPHYLNTAWFILGFCKCVCVCVCWWVPVWAHAIVQVWQREPLPDVGCVPAADPGAGGSDGLPGGVCQAVRGHRLWVQTAPTMQVKPKAGRRKYYNPVPNSKLMSHYSRDALLHSQSVSEEFHFSCWFHSLCPLSCIPEAWGGPAEGAVGHDHHGGVQHGGMEDDSLERDQCGGHGAGVQTLL